MHKKTFLLALMIASSPLLFGQPQPGNGNGNGNGNGAPGSGPGAPGDPPAQLVFSPTSIPDGQYGASFKNLTLKVSGGKDPYSFSISGGGLPPGMSLSGNGSFSGVPVAAGSFSFTVTATDNSKSPLSGAQNYTLAIDPATLTVTPNNASMTYGGAVPTLTVTYRGFVNGDNASSLATQATVSTTAGTSSPAGAYPITVSGAADPNYHISYASGTLTVSPAVLAVTANAATKAFGAPDPVLTYNVSGLLNGDNTGILTGSLSRTPGENPGSYPISRGSVAAGPNYTIGYTGNYLTITNGTQHITWAQDLLVGCNSTTQIQLTATASSGLPVTYAVSDPAVATVSGNVLTLVNPGTAVVTATQKGNAGYGPATAVTDTLVYAPASLISQHWGDALFFDNSSGDYVQWQWYKNGQAVPGATDPYYSETPGLNGQYYVIATNKSGQQVESCTLSITAGAAIPGGIKVAPNPVPRGSLVTVTSNYTGPALGGATLQVMDLTGRVVNQVKKIQPSMQMYAPSDTGIYIFNLHLASGQSVSTNVLVD